MKDSEFIQLLNLYLDHEISPADSARLEAEVQRNPERRKIYEQYCRMQKACRMLAEDFVTDVQVQSDRKVVPFSSGLSSGAESGKRGNFYTVGTLIAAAACVAIIFVGRSRENAESLANAEAAALAAQSNAMAAKTRPVETGIASSLVTVSSQSGPRALGSLAGSATMVSDPLLLTGKAQAEAVRAAAMEQARAQFAWIEAMQLPPLQASVPAHEVRFENVPAMRSESRALGNRPLSNGNVEMTAFQFVK